ncbi:hypothetical protein PG996_008216 [Apiospora saccharicola]|uniref:SET domain-containing protein n=1 Tax=Apiospora saccharicola TaxID=335842 RepID=A0ABR1UXA1_9PEZI
MEPDHPYRKLKIPENAPVELKPIPGKGWGMFATRDIHPNEIVLEEKSLFVISDLSDLCPLEDEIRVEVEALDEDEQEQFFSLRRNGSELFDTLEEAFWANNFTQIGTDFPDDGGLQLLMSRFNYSCTPNAMIPNFKGFDDMDPETTVIISTKRIPAGTEITFSYNMAAMYYLRRDERRIALPFHCLCEACNEDDPNVTYISDLCRTLLRGLDSLLHMGFSRGVKDTVDTEANPVILNPGLRAAAADCNILHSTRFIGYILIPCLLEVERNLGIHTSGIYCGDVEELASRFKSPANIHIANEVLQQPWWADRLLVALHLWNRADDGDVENAALAREEFGMKEPVDSVGIWQDDSSTTPIIEEID